MVSSATNSVSRSPAAASAIAPDGREQEQREELAAIDAVLGQVAAGEQRRQPAAEAEQEAEEEREAIDHEVRRELARALEPLGTDPPQRRGS